VRWRPVAVPAARRASGSGFDGEGKREGVQGEVKKERSRDTSPTSLNLHNEPCS